MAEFKIICRVLTEFGLLEFGELAQHRSGVFP
jgi:hypothetical protein